MPLTIPESRVLDVWQSPVQHRKDLKTIKNEPIRVIYPGRPNDGRGADLRDAVIATPNGLIKGDIEIHVNSRDWWLHGHHEDPAYNSVVLHVVRKHDAGRETVLQNGIEVSTLALESYTEPQTGRRITSAFSPFMPVSCRAGPELVIQLLDEAGEARFSAKAMDLREDILKDGPAQVLYQGIMTALGYSKNKEPMAKLAKAVPLEELEEITFGPETDNECLLQIQARLLGTAGLLPSQRFTGQAFCNPENEFAAGLERRWQEQKKPARMTMKDWQFFKVRPGNYPVRRIAAMSALLVRYRQQGLLAGLQSVIDNNAGNVRPPEEFLIANAGGFWEKFIDFGVPAKGTAMALLGKERAAEIIINVLLPFYAANDRTAAQQETARKAFDFYRRYPAPAENSLESHMRRQLGIPLKMVASALRRQGLLHVYKTLCMQGRCSVCPLYNG